LTGKDIKIRVLAVSRDAAVLRLLLSMGELRDWQLETAANAWEAMERVQSGAAPNLLFLDLPQGDRDGLHILRWLRRLCPALPIVLLGYPDDDDTKREALRLGAVDYFTRPVNNSRLEMVFRHVLFKEWELPETDVTSDGVELIGDDSLFIAINPIMRKLRVQAGLLAESDAPVLILGEGGTGKETTARLVHKLSVRSRYEFAKVNCAALPSDLLEKEMFGCEQDGATARIKRKVGKLELCDKGTLLLDEITEMPMRIQDNLLSVLQSKRFIRPGTSNSVEIDVRIVAASTTNMEYAISKKRLRDDLYYHLSAYTVNVPPLRERMEELPLLSHSLMRQFSRYYGLPPRDFSPATVEAWQAYSWPGNLRELKAFVKDYLMQGDKQRGLRKDRTNLDEMSQSCASGVPRSVSPLPSSLVAPSSGAARADSLRSLVQGVKLEAEKNAIAAALKETGWNRKAAARLLKISYRTLLYKIEQYQMTVSDSAAFPPRQRVAK
jgi:two-component system, NtrC family, response regulator AtoC